MSLADILTVNTFDTPAENWKDFTVNTMNEHTLNVSGNTTLNNLTVTGNTTGISGAT